MREIPTVTKNLLIINVIAFFAMYVLGLRNIDLNDILGLHFFKASDFQLYQLVTYMFMHANWQHIFFNMFALWMFGVTIENVMGQKRFLTYYLICGIGAGLIQELVQLIAYYAQGLQAYEIVDLNGQMKMGMDVFLNSWTTVGASGAIYGILLAFGMIFPEERIFIFPLPVPIKAKWFVMVYAAIELISGLASYGSSNVAHFGHLGGMLFGFLLIRHWQNRGGGNRRFFTGRRPMNRFFRQ